MAQTQPTQSRKTSNTTSSQTWPEPDAPVGDSPPLARWPLVVAAALWGVWIIFLACMAIARVRTPLV